MPCQVYSARDLRGLAHGARHNLRSMRRRFTRVGLWRGKRSRSETFMYFRKSNRIDTLPAILGLSPSCPPKTPFYMMKFRNGRSA